MRFLTAEQVNQFKLNGFLIVEDVLSKDEIEVLAERTDLIAANKVNQVPDTSIQLEKIFNNGEQTVTDQILSVRKLYNLAVYDQIMWEHVTHTKIVDIITDLLVTDDVKMYGDQLFMKAPKTGTAQGWHQDSASWRDIFPMDLVTAWTAIDHATEENGCLNFIPGTHRWGMMSSHRLKHFLSDLGSNQWPIVPIPLQLDKVFKGLDKVKLVAVADADPEGLIKAGRRLDVSNLYNDYRQMLEVEKPDIVSIAPDWISERVPMIEAAASVGSHIYCEKPVAGNLVEIDAIVNACSKGNRRFNLSYIWFR